jgi:hypothetical protein
MAMEILGGAPAKNITPPLENTTANRSCLTIKNCQAINPNASKAVWAHPPEFAGTATGFVSAHHWAQVGN